MLFKSQTPSVHPVPSKINGELVTPNFSLIAPILEGRTHVPFGATIYIKLEVHHPRRKHLLWVAYYLCSSINVDQSLQSSGTEFLKTLWLAIPIFLTANFKDETLMSERMKAGKYEKKEWRSCILNVRNTPFLYKFVFTSRYVYSMVDCRCTS